MSDKPRTVADIEAEIQRTRLAMQSTVDEITGRIDPRTQAKDFADRAKASANDMGKRASDTIDGAKAGDPGSLAMVASAATGIAVVAGLFFLRRKK
ncbi:MAG: DUF3618 domain-containing protein [Actinomycetaceae bacterium]|nr:DUF3618 domain-containing protein [Actinomycetaceae bacterium]